MSITILGRQYTFLIGCTIPAVTLLKHWADSVLRIAITLAYHFFFFFLPWFLLIEHWRVSKKSMRLVGVQNSGYRIDRSSQAVVYVEHTGSLLKCPPIWVTNWLSSSHLPFHFLLLVAWDRVLLCRPWTKSFCLPRARIAYLAELVFLFPLAASRFGHHHLQSLGKK